jgi:predicted nucleic acid-binding protein
MEDVGRGPVGIDPAISIYYIEEHSHYFAPVNTLFEAIDRNECRGVTSSLTLLETLVVPFRAGDTALAERYELLLSRSRGLEIVDLDRPILRAAARLRARYALKTPDSIQLAAALSRSCPTFLTHDRPLSKVEGIQILQIGHYLSEG